MSDRERTAELLAALARRILGPEGQGHRAVAIDEVRASVSPGSRTADLLSLGLWTSRGFLFEGWELKVSRSDWLNELNAPEKADAVARYCDRWWLVTLPDIVGAGELPSTWGHMIRNGRRWTCAQEPTALDPEPIPRDFLAALLRRAMTGDRLREIANARAAAEQVARDNVAAELESHKLDASRSREQLERRDSQLREFAERAGLTIWELLHSEDLNRIADVTRAVRDVDGDTHTMKRNLNQTLSRLEAVRSSVTVALDSLEGGTQ